MTEYRKVRNKYGFYQAEPTPSEQELQNFYEKTYYQKGQIYSLSYTNEEIALFNNKAKVCEYIINKYQQIAEKSMLDLGCGEGFTANYFLKHGWNVQATDFSSFAVERFNPDLLPFFIQKNIYTILTQFNDENKKFNFINLSNVLEHVIDPIMLLEKIKLIMYPQSILRIEVPNDDSKTHDYFISNNLTTKENWFGPPQHLSYFSFESLITFCEQLGFKTILKQTNFPNELFIFNELSNYYLIPEAGRKCHLARVKAENFWIEDSIENYINFMEVSCNLVGGIGRNIILYITKR